MNWLPRFSRSPKEYSGSLQRERSTWASWIRSVLRMGCLRWRFSRFHVSWSDLILLPTQI